jgi:hypothetical protein
VKGSLAPTFKTVPPPLEERSGKKNFSTTPLVKNLYLRNQVHHTVALIAENALKLTYAYLYFKKFCMDKKLLLPSLPLPTLLWWSNNFVWKKVRFNKVLNLAPKVHLNSSVSIYIVNNFPRVSPRIPIRTRGEGRKEGRKEGKKRRGDWMDGDPPNKILRQQPWLPELCTG